MRSEILSSNFDLLNLRAARRSLFGGGSNSGSGGNNEYNDNNNSIISNSQSRRQNKRSQSHPGPSSETQTQAPTNMLSSRRPLEQRPREPRNSTSTSSSSSFFSRPSRQRSTSSWTRAAAAAAAAADPVADSSIGDVADSVPSSVGTKRKRPGLPRTRAGSGASSRAATYRMTREASSLSAPLSQGSIASLQSASGSEYSSSSHLSRRTSKSSSSLRQGLHALVIDSQSAKSPTRARSGRHSSGQEASVSPESLADTTIGRRSVPSRKGSSSKPYNHHIKTGEAEDDEESRNAEDEGSLLLNLTPPVQLERLRKDSLVTLTVQVGLPSDGLTRPQLIEGLLRHRESHRRHDTNGETRAHPDRKRKASLASKRSISSQSADYTDESDESEDDDEAGHEGGGEETEAEGLAGAAASRKRKPLHRNKIEDVFTGSFPSAKFVGNRKIRGVRTNRLPSPQKTTDDNRLTELSAATTPVINRLRNAKSMQFAASSPLRARARTRGPLLGTKRAAPSLPDPSPVKTRLRKAKSSKTLTLGRTLKFSSPKDDRMDEDWVDSWTAATSRRDQTQRRAKILARRKLQAGVEHDNMTSGNEDQEGRGYRHSGEERGDEEEEAAFPLSTQTDGEAVNGDDEEEDQGDATEREEDPHDDSDMTNVPDDAEDEDYDHSAVSPSKMRRLRNGKVRIKPTIIVRGSGDDAVSSLRPLNSISAPKRALGIGGKVKAGKTKPLTPPLSAGNPGAVSAGPENLDELNGLDLESLSLTDKEIPARQLEKLSRIGSGGFKDVFVGILKVGKRRNKVAIADIREKLTEMDIKELGLLRDLKHENIVRFIGVSIPEDTAKTGIPCMIVSELCSNGDLWDYVRNVKPPSDLQIFRMLLETAKGLEYLHMHSIVHRDVKSSNVLVTRNRSCKINDFGLARVKTSQRSKMKSVVGTINWQAVELWCRQPQYNEKVDVWSAAMTFWETLQWYEEYKSYPFEGMNDFVIYEEVGKEGKRPPTDKIAEQFGEEIIRLLNRMWDTDPRKRPTMDMVCQELERLIEIKEMEMDE